mmetsp:Transcript_5911/g.8718  ORF Transcript_5911/g.8718 Transcript_5911/m.8718 type:complete len:751 (+) Transcript_5911:256-2508(+)
MKGEKRRSIVARMFKPRRQSLAIHRRATTDSNAIDDEFTKSLQSNSNNDHDMSILRSSATSNDHNFNWDLRSCIDTIESLLQDGSTELSEDQKAAIENLRSASSSASQSKKVGKGKFGNSLGNNIITRLSGGKPIMPRQKSLFMTEEMRETWIEVEADLDDRCRKQCVHDVLEAYGGGKFDPAWGSRGQVPTSLKRSTSGKTERRSAAAHPEIATMLMGFKGDSMKVLAKSMVAGSGFSNYCPPEWNRLTPDAKKELTNLLSLENLSKWEFDVFKVAELTRMTLTPEETCTDCDGTDCDDSPSRKMLGGEQFCPLLFVGWAILCAPMAQSAMKGSLEGYYNTRDDSDPPRRASVDSLDNGDTLFHYSFDEHLKIYPEAICNFLREIERRYSTDTPYHNNVHAADVTQTLHSLFAFIGKDLLYSISKPLEIFSLILAATFHDVGHPGTNNLFHKNAMTPFAVEYNDVSILENMHAAVGHSLLMGEERKDEWDVFKNWKQSQIVEARGIMIRAVLGTDMSNHFLKMDDLLEKIENVRFTANIVLQSELGEDSVSEEEDPFPSSRRSRDEKDQQQMLEMLGSLSDTRKLNKDGGNKEQTQILGILAQVRDKSIQIGDSKTTYTELKTECRELSSSILVFLLHSADISNPAKPQNLAVRWANKALTEFFAQGDKEKELAIPVSPLCDSETTKTADSQIGFLQFVVRPLYVLLGDIVPRVKEEVLPIVDKNLEYWQDNKSRSSILRKQEQQEQRH